MIGASVLAIGGYFTWRNLHVTQQTLKATQDKLEVDREAQITNRFTQAIGQLGAHQDGQPNLEVRLGGIYALERIARDSPRDHWVIMEILTAYVRQNAPWRPSSTLPDHSVSLTEQPAEEQQETPDFLNTDVQAVLTVLGRRALSDDRRELGRLDLRETDLRRADLKDAHLERADLLDAHLEEATLIGIHLEGAILGRVLLKRADLRGAHLGHRRYAARAGGSVTHDGRRVVDDGYCRRGPLPGLTAYGDGWPATFDVYGWRDITVLHLVVSFNLK